MQAYDNWSHYVNVHKLQLSRVNWQWADSDRPHINVVIIRLNVKHFKTSHLAGSTLFSSEKQGRQTKTKVTFDVYLDLINIDPIHVYLYLDLVNSDPINVYLDLVNSDPIHVCVASLFQGAVCSDHEVGQEDNVPRQLRYALVIYGFLH